MTYDAKSTSLIEGQYCFHFNNNEKEEIEIFYLGAFNKDFTILEHVLRIPREFVEKLSLCIGLSNNHRYNFENMKEYEITEKYKKNLSVI